MSQKQQQNLQDIFLNACRKQKVQVTVYLNNGVKLQGMITGFDNFSIILRRSTQTQLVYKHGVATVVPQHPIQMQDQDDQSTPAAEPASTAPDLPENEPFHIA
jgi:host factor-I protein